MTPIVAKFLLTVAVVLVGTLAGYGARRSGLLTERVGERLMTLVAVFGYPLVGFLSVWGTALRPADLALPVLACVHVLAMTWAALALSGLVSRDRRERGMLAVLGGMGNNGFTMGAFILYLLRGEKALGLANVYFLLILPLMVLVIYPLARRYAAREPALPLGRLMLRNLLDWRSVGLPITLAAVALSLGGVPRPDWIGRWRVVDGLVFGVTPAAFFAIGLRLRLARVAPLWRQSLWLAGVRFAGGLAAGLALVCLVRWTPWRLEGLRWTVFMVQAFVPTSVSSVAVANMFDLQPGEATVLFVTNTALYVASVLPPLFVWCG